MSHAAARGLLLAGLPVGTAEAADPPGEPVASAPATRTPSDAPPVTILYRAEQDRRVAQAHDLLDRWGGGADLEKARQQLQSVLQANPRHVQAHIEMARYDLDMGNEGTQVDREELGRASRELAAENVEPNNANVQILLGKVREDLHHYPDAVDALDRAKALGTHNPWWYLNYASTDAAMGRWDQSAVRLRTLQSENPQLVDPLTA
jgi:cytochrome c-type biogenesis protein CcmH/NrfG